MDDFLEDIAAIDSLTVNNLGEVSFMDMLKILEPFVLAKVPEGTFNDNNAKRRLDYLLGRLANSHAYVKYLWTFATYKAAESKKLTPEDRDNWLKKKEALYELSGAIKLKYEACSRMLTVAMGEEPGKHNPTDKVDFDAHRQKPSTNTGPVSTNVKKNTGWGNVG